MNRVLISLGNLKCFYEIYYTVQFCLSGIEMPIWENINFGKLMSSVVLQCVHNFKKRPHKKCDFWIIVIT